MPIDSDEKYQPNSKPKNIPHSPSWHCSRPLISRSPCFWQSMESCEELITQPIQLQVKKQLPQTENKRSYGIGGAGNISMFFSCF